MGTSRHTCSQSTTTYSDQPPKEIPGCYHLPGSGWQSGGNAKGSPECGIRREAPARNPSPTDTQQRATQPPDGEIQTETTTDINDLTTPVSYGSIFTMPLPYGSQLAPMDSGPFWDQMYMSSDWFPNTSMNYPVAATNGCAPGLLYPYTEPTIPFVNTGGQFGLFETMPGMSVGIGDDMQGLHKFTGLQCAQTDQGVSACSIVEAPGNVYEEESTGDRADSFPPPSCLNTASHERGTTTKTINQCLEDLQKALAKGTRYEVTIRLFPCEEDDPPPESL